MATNAERQAAKRQRDAASGLTTLTIVVPTHTVADFRLAAELARTERELTVGPMRNQATGRLRPLRAR